jgi:glycosyltransferase involved in cell wall biosynthesis
MSPLVSIVIPCFNYGRFLGEAIESALGQTHQPVQVVVVDDGSSDDTVAVAQRYPVKLISQRNAGLSCASNVGIRASAGELVVRLDADDRLAPTYVEETLDALLREPPVEFAYTEMQYFGAASGTYPVEEFDPETLTERNYVHASALMRRSAFDAVGGYRENMTTLRVQDWDLWLSFVERGFQGRLVRKPLLEYRKHAGPSMVTFDLLSPKGLRREITMASRLQDNHPRLFASQYLLRRLRRLPVRLRTRDVSPRFAALLFGFYLVMLTRSALGLAPRASQSGVL